MIEYNGSELCSYGCGNIAKYFFNNTKKYCCSSHFSKCPIRRQRSKKYMTGLRVGEKNPNYGKKLTEEQKEKIRQGNKNNNYIATEETKRKMSISSKLSIEKIKEKYPTFSKIEDMRYEPGKENERIIQVRCKNHKCKNSKEQDGWFTPTYIQFYERIRNIEIYGKDYSYLYCCEQCKQECPLYNFNPTDFLNYINKDESEIDLVPDWLRNKVLERDNNKCLYCDCNENLEVHHILSVKLYPRLNLDIENMITCCRECHLKYAHGDKECTTGYLKTIKCKEYYYV